MKKILIPILAGCYPFLSLAVDSQQTCLRALEANDFDAAAKTATAQNTYEGLMCAGKAQLATNDYASAELTFNSAKKLSASKFDSMVAITFLARSMRNSGKVEESLAQYQRCLKLAKEMDFQQGQWTSLNEMGQIFQEKEDFVTALKNFKQASQLASNDNERSESNRLIAETYFQSNDLDHAIEYQLKSVVMEERGGDLNHILNAKLLLASYTASAKDYIRSIKELEDIIKVSREVESVYWEARATLSKSHISKLQGDLENAKSLLQSALSLAEKSKVQPLIDAVRIEMKGQ